MATGDGCTLQLSELGECLIAALPLRDCRAIAIVSVSTSSCIFRGYGVMPLVLLFLFVRRSLPFLI